VLLVSYSADGTVIERTEISFIAYYEGPTPVVDSNAFRLERGVRRLTGEIYNSKGVLQQSFDNTYDEEGKYVGGRSVFEDETVVEA
jgi:hypothetical protein